MEKALSTGLKNELYKTPLSSGLLKTTSDEKLLMEIAKKGYDISRLSKNAETQASAKIVKIG